MKLARREKVKLRRANGRAAAAEKRALGNCGAVIMSCCHMLGEWKVYPLEGIVGLDVYNLLWGIRSAQWRD